MKFTAARASSVIAVFAAVASLASACGGSSTNDGGTGGTGAQTTPADFCSTYSAYAKKCNIVDPCTTGILADCTSFAASFSSGYLDAFSACASQATCADGGGTAASACFASAQASLKPTAAQEKLASDYCASCATAPQTPAECAASFYATGDAGAGVGAAFLDINDTIIGSIDTQCAETLGPDAGITGCTEGFYLCLLGQVSKVVTPPAACTTPAGSDADGG